MKEEEEDGNSEDVMKRVTSSVCTGPSDVTGLCHHLPHSAQ
jgi:uncharacterized Zn finger protein